MRKHFIIVASLALCAVGTSCKKIYESVPVENLTDAYIWDDKDSSAKYATQFMSDLYASIPTGYNRIQSPGILIGDFLDAASDDAVSSRTANSSIANMARGGITVFNNPDNLWGSSYASIRKATVFLNNFHIVPFKSTYEKRSWFGEARALRAYFYWELVRRWGGVPLMGDEPLALEDGVDIPRNSFERCIEYIVSECDRAIDSLRNDPIDDANLGRWSKGSAMALKAQVLLFAASPLYNGGNAGDSLTGYASYDPQRWKRAADAARAVMDMNVFSLQSNFIDIFISKRSPEVIAAKMMGTGRGVEADNGPINFSSAPAGGLTSPTQELVDAYGMSNGKPISDPTSGYDPANPYASRDPRLGYTVFYNGSPWLNSQIETFNGGQQRPGGSFLQTQTGYYMRKFMGRFETESQYSSQYHDWILFRYAGMLLNYAEAMNEFAGPSPEAYKAVEDVRQRAGLDPYTLDPGLTKEQLREVIRNERRKEFAFEEYRYWDIRRWKIAGEVYNKPLHGIVIVKDPSGNYTYGESEVITTAFDESKMYFYPIPFAEMMANDKMVQNPGWE